MKNVQQLLFRGKMEPGTSLNLQEVHPMAFLEHDILVSEDLRRVPQEELQGRLERLRAALTAQDPSWQMAVVSDKLDMYYFTGTMQEGAFLVRPQDAILWVRRSLERARNESLLPSTQILPMHSYRQAAQFYGEDLPAEVYLDEKHTSLEWLRFFHKYFPFTSRKNLDPILGQLRSVKSPYELALLTTSGRIHGDVLMQEAPVFLKEGISEAELAIQLYLRMVLKGSQGVARTNRPLGEDVIGLASFGKSALVRTAFDGPGGTGGTCVAVQSIGSAFRLLKQGRLVYLDIPCGFDGYNTDKTVVYYYGNLDRDPAKEEILRAYNYCLSLEQKTISLMKPGAVLGDIYDQVMADFDPRYEGIFMNGGRFLGHSIGMCMDETPVIAGGVKEKIRENMVFAVEPKIALPELGMVGTENTYRIGPDGPVCLTGGPQPLRVVR